MGKVKNLNGSSKYRAKNGEAWLANWEEIKDVKAKKCHNSDCKTKENLVGAHVMKDSSTDEDWYIVPFCKSCNGMDSTKLFDVPYSDLVAVNKVNE